jgi:hypothetical protein
LAFSCQVWLQQESILFGLLKGSQACLELAAAVYSLVVAAVWQLPASSDGVGVVAHLFFQCILVWRTFPQARVQGAKFSILPNDLLPPSMAPVSQLGS